MSEWKLKRFWKSETVSDVQDGFTVLLDGRGVRTPAKAQLVVPTRALAEAIAAEWAAQEGEVDPAAMPFTRSANAAIDKVRVQQAEVADMLADYADSDLLCYRAEGPDDLVARQALVWGPYLDWAAEALDARLTPVPGVMHAPQDAGALKRLRALTHKQSHFELAAFHDLVSLSGSIILAFAAVHAFADADAIWDASRLDEIWQIEQWGSDEDAIDVAERKKAAFLHANSFWSASRNK